MTAEQLRAAENEYIYHDKTLPEISQDQDVTQEDLAEYRDTWEFRRQAYRTAEYLYCREGKTLDEIKQLTPLTLAELKKWKPRMQKKREAYLASVPSSLLTLHDLLTEKILALTSSQAPLVPLGKIQKLYETLKPDATIFDHYELILNIITHHFLPTKQYNQKIEDQLITVLEEFRGFLKLQLMSGNR